MNNRIYILIQNSSIKYKTEIFPLKLEKIIKILYSSMHEKKGGSIF